MFYRIRNLLNQPLPELYLPNGDKITGIEAKSTSIKGYDKNLLDGCQQIQNLLQRKNIRLVKVDKGGAK